MTRMDRQSEAHTMAISECMSRSMGMMKDTCESVKECVKVVTDSTQNNFQQLLNEIRETRFERVHTAITSPSGTSSHPLITSAWSSEERPLRAGTRSQEPASRADTQTATIPSVAQTVCLQSTHNTQNSSRSLLSEI